MELRRLPICHECLSALRQPLRASTRRRFAAPPLQQHRPISARAHNDRIRTAAKTAPKPPQHSVRILESLWTAARSAHTISSQDLNALHNRINLLADSALNPEDGKLPEEQRVLYVLEQLHALAKNLIDGHHTADTAGNPEESGLGKEESRTATSALLGSVNARSYPAFITQASLLHQISAKAEQMLRHPNIFITPAILKAYVELQTLLHQPSSFPDIFTLYAHKPLPHLSPNNKNKNKNNNGSNSVTYTPPNPHKINAAIDPQTARLALTSATATHNLPLALDIITTTFSTPSFRKAKTLRRGLIPFTGLAIAPLAAYTLSTHFGTWQTTMDPHYATGVAFAGILTYVASVSSIGYVAITTANDQMERVTWAPGVPLWERWVREEERAAVDCVAGGWGFEAREMRGEEEGREWEGLREWVGVRGMVLDRAELMEGME